MRELLQDACILCKAVKSDVLLQSVDIVQVAPSVLKMKCKLF
jgi:hypothetical protein